MRLVVPLESERRVLLDDLVETDHQLVFVAFGAGLDRLGQ
jgi:hypothetical protein